MLADVVQRKGAAAGSLDGWGSRRVFPFSDIQLPGLTLGVSDCAVPSHCRTRRHRLIHVARGSNLLIVASRTHLAVVSTT